MDFESLLSQIAACGAKKTADEWLKNIEKEYGIVPLIFERMSERPEILISHLLYKSAVVETSAIEPKYIELISLAVGAALKCNHCVEYHMQAAKKKGATKQEILEVILIAGMLANSSVLADAYRIINGVDERCPACDLDRKCIPNPEKEE